MSYRTVLVYLDDTPRTHRLVDIAAGLARSHGSHLFGLAPSGRAPITGETVTGEDRAQPGCGGPDALLEQARKVARAFVEQAAASKLESSDVHVDADDASASMMRHGACADLLVIPQSDYQAPAPTVAWSFPPQVVIGSGRPALILPTEGEFPTLGERVLIAWNGSREANRAVADALPLLRAARSVKVVVVNEEPEGGPAPKPLQPTHVTGWLARHGVLAELSTEAHKGKLGRRLLHKAAEQHADLLVMGCYAQARLGELMLGGATRAVLADMKIPVLMSH